MTGVGIRLEGKDAALAALGRAAHQAGNPRGLYDRIGLSLVASTQARFDAGIGPDGSPWPPSLRALADGGKTLIKRAKLVGSLTHQASDSGVDVGTNVVYAAIHQLGGTITQGAREQVIHFKKNSRTGTTRFAKANKRATFAQKVSIGEHAIVMPARPFLGVDADDERNITAISGDWLLGERGANNAD